MKRTWCTLAAVLVVMLLSGMAWGYPTRFGPATGLVDLPTADVELPGGAEFAGDYSKLAGDQKVATLRLLASVAESAELGVLWAKVKGGVGDDMGAIAGKLALLREQAAGYGLAVGASYLHRTQRDVLNVYVVGSKELAAGEAEGFYYQEPRVRTRGHVGIMFTSIDNGVKDDEVKPFLGLDITTPGGISFVADYKFTKFGRDHAAAAFRYPVSPAVTVQLGVARESAVLAQDSMRFFAGFNYNFVVRGEETRPF